MGGRRAALWRLPAGKLLATVDSEVDGRAWLGVMTPDGAALVTAGTQVPTELRSLPKGTLLATLEGRKEDDHVTALAVSGDGSTLAAAYGSGAIVAWALPERRRLARRHEHGGVINGLAFSADGRFLVSAGTDHSVKVWALPGLTARHTFRGHEDEVTGVAVSATGLVASGDRSGVVRLWDVESGAAKGTLVDPSLR